MSYCIIAAVDGTAYIDAADADAAAERTAGPVYWGIGAWLTRAW